MNYRFLLILALLATACKTNNTSSTAANGFEAKANNPEILHKAVRSLTDVIILDVFSPPVSSRIYSYSTIAAYEALRHLKPGYASLSHQLRDLGDLPEPDPQKKYCFPLAAIHAFYTTAHTFIFSKEILDKSQEEIMNEFKNMNIPSDVYANSIAFGDTLASSIKAWAAKDNYKNLSNKSNYTTSFKEGTWIPTWRDYDLALEPNWSSMRPMVLDSANQFRAGLPLKFGKVKTCDFYNKAMEVKNIVDSLTEEQIKIAVFWDDNPAVTKENGHMMVKRKKMTPAGHWINIVRQASEKTKLDILTSSEAYMLTSLGIYDGFLACWYEKYHYNLIRPITYINEYIDPNWRPYLQTPNFPEHTSGHSVISAAAAEVCTYIFGDNFAMTDSTEHEFGHGVRSFDSFRKAADEVSISRVYGGIHYRNGCESGQVQGMLIGQNVLNKVKTRPNSVGAK